MRRRRIELLVVVGIAGACSSDGSGLPLVDGSAVDAAAPAPDAGAADAGIPDAGTADAALADAMAADAAPPDAAAPGCVTVDGTATVVATATTADDHALTVTAASESATRWSERGNEAVVLEVTGAARGVVGHLVLHQGRARFAYAMHVGRLDAGEAISVRVSPLSAAGPAPRVCVDSAVLTPASALGASAEGLRRAPIFRWPVAKRFDDLPVLVGWSAATRSYQAVYTSENGGTVASCGGGADGMQAEIARWGRGCDIEGVFAYGAASPTWGRCTGTTSFAQVAPRLEGDHPVFYYGDGHNRLFEHRGGYGRTCGAGGAERSDGDLTGWNVANPGNDAARDDGLVVTLRPLPVDLDATGFAAFRGRREALLDIHAPWIYRLTFLELAREGAIDGARTMPMEQYLYVDVHAADVDGAGDRECAGAVSRGFVLRVTTPDGVVSGPQMTASYFGADHDWKRIAIPLSRAYAPSEIESFVFDAYDNDGIYLLALGDAFLVRADGDNGASLAAVHTGVRPIDVYVDDDRSGCTDGVNRDGPGGRAYPCTGSDARVPVAVAP
jgi:hypothetical protein